MSKALFLSISCKGEVNYRTDLRLSAKIRDFNSSDFELRVLKYRFVYRPGSGDAAGGIVSGFLQYVSSVSARPFPAYFVRGRGAIQPFPPRMVRFSPKTTIHCLNDISRICEHIHLARLSQRLEPHRRRGDFSLLVRRRTQVFAERAPVSFVAEQCDRRGATRVSSIAEARAVAKNRDLLERRSLSLIVAHT